jgi:hypothetical protein
MKLSSFLRLVVCFFALFLLCGTSHAQTDCTNSPAPVLTPASVNFPNTGGGTTILVSFQGDCNWHPVNNTSFIHIVSFTGLGGGSLQYSVDPNPNLAPRFGSFSIFSSSIHNSSEVVTQDAASGDFSLLLVPASQTVLQGATATFNINITRTGGFNGFINLSTPGAPAGVTETLGNFGNSSATLTVAVSSGAPIGPVTITVSGVNGNVTRSASASLDIQQPPDFSLAVTPTLQTAVQGTSATYQVAINRVGSFTGPVTLSGPSLPGVSFDFAPNNTVGGISTMTVTTTSAAPPGPANLSITGSGVINGITASRSTSATLNIIQPPVALRFVPVTPCRVADTRNPNGPFGGPFLIGGFSRGFVIPNSSCGVPLTAQAYSINATVVPHGQLGFLTMYPCGENAPVASTLNSIDGRVKAGAAIVPAGTSGGICALPSNDTDLILDINGYFVPATNASALAFYSLAPCRVSDTRGPTGPLGGPFLAGGTTQTIPILSSACNVPSGAVAYSLNFTVVPKGGPLGHLITWAAGQPQPLVSTLNAPTGTVTASAAIVPAGANGAISVFALNDTDLIIDINGYFAPPATGGLSLFTAAPCRVLDTRNPPGSPPFTGTINVNIAGSVCGIPATAQSYVLNTTVVPPGPLGFLTLWAQGAAQPSVSTLNAVDGAVTSNMAIVHTSNGFISVFAPNPTHLVSDISGYFAP